MESHGQDLRSVVASDDQARAVEEDYRTAKLRPREVVLLDYAVKLTKSPASVTADDIHALREAGYTDEQIVDSVHCVGYFNFITRVLDGLGVDPEGFMLYGREGKIGRKGPHVQDGVR